AVPACVRVLTRTPSLVACVRVCSLAVPASPPSRFCLFNDTATTEIYTLSLHDALPISGSRPRRPRCRRWTPADRQPPACRRLSRSEEHTSELQSRFDLVCRLLLEKKKQNTRPREPRGAGC